MGEQHKCMRSTRKQLTCVWVCVFCVNHVRCHFKLQQRASSDGRETIRLKLCPTLQTTCIKLTLAHTLVMTTAAAVCRPSVILRHEGSLMQCYPAKKAWMWCCINNGCLTLQRSLAVKVSASCSHSACDLVCSTDVHTRSVCLRYLIVQLQHLLFIAACFVLLGFVQLSDFPQLLSQLPHLLLQSLLITAPRALPTHNTHHFTTHTHTLYVYVLLPPTLL